MRLVDSVPMLQGKVRESSRFWPVISKNRCITKIHAWLDDDRNRAIPRRFQSAGLKSALGDCKSFSKCARSGNFGRMSVCRLAAREGYLCSNDVDRGRGTVSELAAGLLRYRA